MKPFCMGTFYVYENDMIAQLIFNTLLACQPKKTVKTDVLPEAKKSILSDRFVAGPIYLAHMQTVFREPNPSVFEMNEEELCAFLCARSADRVLENLENCQHDLLPGIQDPAGILARTLEQMLILYISLPFRLSPCAS